MSCYRRRLIALVYLTSLVSLSLAGCVMPANPKTEALPGEYLFCFWNVENFFDDKLDNYAKEPDKDFDAWFAENPPVLKEKLDHLSRALMDLNGGRGPDILAIAECESERASKLLRDAMNARLADESLHYQHVLYKDPHGGRHIATAIITRLPVVGDRTRLLGKRQRILEGRVTANGHELVVIASHWTSRITDKDGHSRADYANKIYGEFRAMYERNKAVDLLICGDFNDSPEDASVAKHLHAGGNRDLVRSQNEPVLLDLFADKEPQQFGTHYHHRWYIFDHLVVSPGLLDERGWSCDPDSVTTIRTLHAPKDRLKRPWSFGRERDHGERGYSDHFPVTVKLRVG
jgi:endonuclease/exonuclease/phosphatase family metal-dependent hydrolase